AIEGGMLARGQVAHEEHVREPGKVARILRTADEELPLREPARGREEQSLESVLAVRRVRAEVRQVTAVIVLGRDGMMDRWIDAPIERRGAPRAEDVAQRGQCYAAGEAEHDIVIGETARPDVLDGEPLPGALHGHGR